MPRFFLAQAPQGGRITLQGDVARHILSALAIRPEEPIVLCDSGGTDRLCLLEDRTDRTVTVLVTDAPPPARKSALRLTLALALSSVETMECILRMGTELGVQTFVPFYAARSSPDNVCDIVRWRKLTKISAEQCGLADAPLVQAPTSYPAACELAAQADTALLCYEEEHRHTLRDLLMPRDGTLALLIGPPGGFTPQEAQLAEKAGILPVSLGKRILRCETAALAAIATIAYETDTL